MLTHPAREGDVRNALLRIDAMDGVIAKTRALRIEED